MQWSAAANAGFSSAAAERVGRLSLPDAALPAAVLAHRFDADAGTMLFLHNLGGEEARVDLGPQPGTEEGALVEVFADRAYDQPTPGLSGLALGPRGYRWIRLRRG